MKRPTVAVTVVVSIRTCKPVIPNLFQVKTPCHCLFDFMKLVPFFSLKKKKKLYDIFIFLIKLSKNKSSGNSLKLFALVPFKITEFNT